MQIQVAPTSGVQVIRLQGDLKIGQPVEDFRETVDSLMRESQFRLVINLAQVPMIDSSGIGVLVRALTSTRQRGGSLKLVNPSKLAIQTLKIVGLFNLFEVFDDEGKAVQSFAASA